MDVKRAALEVTQIDNQVFSLIEQYGKTTKADVALLVCGQLAALAEKRKAVVEEMGK